ncbi:MAG TPA: amidohydrolase family protein [Nitrospirota bacterium]|nr:amidohydrolase family protein [Nitrospirota bacterium]
MALAKPFTQYFVDIHVHGAERYDTRTRRQDDILQIAAIHGRRGTGAIVPTIYPGAIDLMRAQMEAVRRAREAQREGAAILGVNLEGPFLNPSHAGALDGKSFLEPSVEDFTKLVAGYEDIIRIMTIAPELPGALRLIELGRGKGFLMHMGHSDASFEQADEGKRAGATGITHLFNGMRGFHHREPGLAGFGIMDEEIRVEVIADMAHLHAQSLKMIFEMKSADKIILVSDAVSGPGWGSGPVRGPGGVLQGGGTALSDAVKNLLDLGIPLDRAIRCASDNPMKYLNMSAA